MRARSLVLTLALAGLPGCQALELPAQQASRRDHDLATRWAAHLRTLPDVTAASVELRTIEIPPTLRPAAPARPAPCPYDIAVILSTSLRPPGHAALREATLNQLAVLAPNCTPTLTIATPRGTSLAPATATAHVGPFVVASESRRPLQLTLIALLLVVGALLIRLRQAGAA